jgi:hypothetical protein
MKTVSSFKAIMSTKAYDEFLERLYAGATRRVEEIEIPPVQVIAVTGNQPPASKQYQDAIAVLYGIAYTLEMGLELGKLRAPAGYFDYKVGALETLWWSEGGQLSISNPKTLRWKAYLMVPPFVTKRVFEEARAMAKARQPELPFDLATLATIDERRAVQMLHVGPYENERPTIDRLNAYVEEHGLEVTGRHHEIYLGDPRRTAPEKLRTVIRLPVAPASKGAGRQRSTA